MAKDPGGPAGTRRIQFRRYVAGVDQRDPQQLARLGDALGALIEEVAESKKDFLVKAAESDGFSFSGGTFKAAATGARSFAVMRAEEMASIDERGRRLQLLATDNPNEAVDGATELVDSICRTITRLIGKPAPRKTTDLHELATATLNALELVPASTPAAKTAAARRCLQHLSEVVASLGELRNASTQGRNDKRNGISSRHARLAVGAAVTFAGFVAETYAARSVKK